MRKIERAMAIAITERKAVSLGNTTTSLHTRQDGKALLQLHLHGSHIATVGYDAAGRPENATGTLAGWDTRLTRSRLSLVACALGSSKSCIGLSRRRGVTRWVKLDGSSGPEVPYMGWFGL